MPTTEAFFLDENESVEPRCWNCGRFAAWRDLAIKRDWETGDVIDQYHSDAAKCARENKSDAND